MELTLDQALQKGVEAHKAGKAQEADRYYTAILKANPKHPDANHNMGVLAVGVGKVEAALPFFKTALETNPNIAQYWLSYIDALIKLDQITDAKTVLDQAKSKGVQGEAFNKIEKNLGSGAKIKGNQTNKEILKKAVGLRENGKYDEAIDLLLYHTRQSPTDPNVTALLSHCYILNDNLEQAKIYLDAAKNINPNIASVGWNETRLLLKQKKVDEALVVAQRTNKLFPDDVEGISVLGSCFGASGNFDESRKYLNKAIEINPNDAGAILNRGLISLTQKDKVNALSDLEKAHQLKPHIKQIWDLIIALYFEENQYEKAINCLVNMIEIDPSHQKSLALLAQCNQKADDTSLAIMSFQRVLEVIQENAPMHVNLGIAMNKQGDHESAVEQFNKALSIKPNHAEAYNNMGVALKDQGKLEEAIKAYTKALSIKPDYDEAYLNMGNALKDQSKLEEAIQAYSKALSLRPDYAEAYLNIGNILENQYKLDEAIEAYNKALSIKPDYARAIHQLGKSYNQLGQANESKKHFEKALRLDPEDTLGVSLELALLGQKEIPSKTPQAYMKDFYKKRSNQWGKGSNYKGHSLIEDAFNSLRLHSNVANILDLGCGTGSLASYLRPYSKNLDGVDLSPDMIKHAKETGSYDAVYQQEIESYLGEISNRYDVVVAAAVLIHFFDLYNILSLIRNSLTENGKLIFSVFEGVSSDKELNEFLTYSHSANYINDLAKLLGFQIKYQKTAIHEYHKGNPISALVYILQK